MIYLAAATFALVFLRAWQQQNVNHGLYWWAAGTSYALSVADVFVIVGVVHYGYEAIPFIGTGGALGVTSSMWLHRRMKR